MTYHTSDFISGVMDIRRGSPPLVTIHTETPPTETWAYDRQPTMGRPRGAHLSRLAYLSEDGTERFLVASCGMCLWQDYDVVDVEDAEDFCERCLMADTHMVYTFYDVAGTPLYVGQSGEVVRRMLQHRISSPWFWWSASAEAQVVDPADARRIEADRIRDLDPTYNKLPRLRGAA